VLRKNLDLLIAVVAAAASVAVIRSLPSVPLRTAFALPLLFVLPGLTLGAALFPGRGLDLERRLLLQVGLSLSVGVLGALVLDVTFGLYRFSWAVLLGAITGVGAAAAAARRIGLDSSGPDLRLPRRLDVALVGIALAVVAGSVVFARTPLAASNVQGYTALSILPVHGHTRAARLEVSSGELRTVSYLLKLHVGPRLITARRLTLAPSSSWQRTVRLSPKQMSGRPWITARLYLRGHPHRAYRSVRIRAR
jgi:uncharacterized protein DUF1616